MLLKITRKRLSNRVSMCSFCCRTKLCGEERLVDLGVAGPGFATELSNDLRSFFALGFGDDEPYEEAAEQRNGTVREKDAPHAGIFVRVAMVFKHLLPA